MNINPFDLGYVVGLFEGEGYCGSYIPGKQKEFVSNILIQMTDLEPLEKVKIIMGIGIINGPYKYKGKKPIYQYRVSNLKEIETFLTLIFPHLSSRRQKQACDCLGDDFAYEMGL